MMALSRSLPLVSGASPDAGLVCDEDDADCAALDFARPFRLVVVDLPVAAGLLGFDDPAAAACVESSS